MDYISKECDISSILEVSRLIVTNKNKKDITDFIANKYNYFIDVLKPYCAGISDHEVMSTVGNRNAILQTYMHKGGLVILEVSGGYENVYDGTSSSNLKLMSCDTLQLFVKNIVKITSDLICLT